MSVSISGRSISKEIKVMFFLFLFFPRGKRIAGESLYQTSITNNIDILVPGQPFLFAAVNEILNE